MNLSKFLKSRIKLILQGDSESQYYEKLFVHNKTWNQPGPNFEETLRWNVIQSFVEFIKNDNNKQPLEILDLGCGRGWLTNLLSKYGSIMGIEPVKPVVNYARKLFPNLEFKASTTKKLLSQKKFKKYNLIVSSEVIEHIPDDKKDDFINDINLLLEDNGYVILTTPRKEAQEEWINCSPANQPIEDWITEAELEALLIKKSFKKIQLKRAAMSPMDNAPEIEIYQLWLFQKY